MSEGHCASNSLDGLAAEGSSPKPTPADIAAPHSFAHISTNTHSYAALPHLPEMAGSMRGLQAPFMFPFDYGARPLLPFPDAQAPEHAYLPGFKPDGRGYPPPPPPFPGPFPYGLPFTPNDNQLSNYPQVPRGSSTQNASGDEGQDSEMDCSTSRQLQPVMAAPAMQALPFPLFPPPPPPGQFFTGFVPPPPPSTLASIDEITPGDDEAADQDLDRDAGEEDPECYSTSASPAPSAMLSPQTSRLLQSAIESEGESIMALSPGTEHFPSPGKSDTHDHFTVGGIETNTDDMSQYEVTLRKVPTAAVVSRDILPPTPPYVTVREVPPPTPHYRDDLDHFSLPSCQYAATATPSVPSVKSQRQEETDTDEVSHSDEDDDEDDEEDTESDDTSSNDDEDDEDFDTSKESRSSELDLNEDIPRVDSPFTRIRPSLLKSFRASKNYKEKKRMKKTRKLELMSPLSPLDETTKDESPKVTLKQDIKIQTSEVESDVGESSSTEEESEPQTPFTPGSVMVATPKSVDAVAAAEKELPGPVDMDQEIPVTKEASELLRKARSIPVGKEVRISEKGVLLENKGNLPPAEKGFTGISPPNVYSAASTGNAVELSVNGNLSGVKSKTDAVECGYKNNTQELVPQKGTRMLQSDANEHEKSGTLHTENSQQLIGLDDSNVESIIPYNSEQERLVTGMPLASFLQRQSEILADGKDAPNQAGAQHLSVDSELSQSGGIYQPNDLSDLAESGNGFLNMESISTTSSSAGLTTYFINSSGNAFEQCHSVKQAFGQNAVQSETGESTVVSKSQTFRPPSKNTFANIDSNLNKVNRSEPNQSMSKTTPVLKSVNERETTTAASSSLLKAGQVSSVGKSAFHSSRTDPGQMSSCAQDVALAPRKIAPRKGPKESVSKSLLLPVKNLGPGVYAILVKPLVKERTGGENTPVDAGDMDGRQAESERSDAAPQGSLLETGSGNRSPPEVSDISKSVEVEAVNNVQGVQISTVVPKTKFKKHSVKSTMREKRMNVILPKPYQPLTSTASQLTQERKSVMLDKPIEDGPSIIQGFYCVDCNKMYPAGCPHHEQNYSRIEDNSAVLTKARCSVPEQLALKLMYNQNSPDFIGVVAQTFIPSKTQFGPLQGLRTNKNELENPENTAYVWEVFDESTPNMVLDCRNEDNSNWLMFVKRARSSVEQNMNVYQQGHDIYFITIKEIQPYTELLYWYAMDYARMLGVCTKPEENFRCPSCHRQFPDMQTLRAHSKAAHPHLQKCTHSCKECGKLFSIASKLSIHENIHKGIKKFECSECGAKFSNGSNLNRHKKLHSDSHKRFECSVCGKKFSQKTHLANHVVIHTDARDHHCRFCESSFRRRIDLLHHERQVHLIGKEYACTEKNCSKVFYKLDNYKKHLLIHRGEKRFECPECQRKFQQKAHMKTHLAIVHKTGIASNQTEIQLKTRVT